MLEKSLIVGKYHLSASLVAGKLILSFQISLSMVSCFWKLLGPTFGYPSVRDCVSLSQEICMVKFENGCRWFSNKMLNLLFRSSLYWRVNCSPLILTDNCDNILQHSKVRKSNQIAAHKLHLQICFQGQSFFPLFYPSVIFWAVWYHP